MSGKKAKLAKTVKNKICFWKYLYSHFCSTIFEFVEEPLDLFFSE